MATANRSNSLVVRFGERYGLEPVRVLDTLKATAFKTEKPISDAQMMALMVVAERHGLDPFTREIFAFPDKGGGIVPVVSVDGWARIINSHPMFDGVQFQWDGTERAMTCSIFRKDRAHPIAVTEYMDECKRGTAPWQSHPRRMIRHKALIQAARLAFGFAGIYDEDEARRIAETPMVERVEPPSASAARVREVLATTADAFDIPEAIGEQAPFETYAGLAEAIARADDADTATLVLEIAAGLTHITPAELAELHRLHASRFPEAQAHPQGDNQ